MCEIPFFSEGDPAEDSPNNHQKKGRFVLLDKLVLRLVIVGAVFCSFSLVVGRHVAA